MDSLNIEFDKLIQFHKPFGLFDYLKLLKNAYCVLSDSGTITEESSILGFPAITMRNSHERPEGMDEGIVIMSGLKPENIMKAIEVTVSQFKENGGHSLNVIKDYDVNNVSKKVIKIILSYTDYVNREVWKK
jgi:UDP-N-acetylglucosamine 2-epimerase (non-hydrolysing)